MSLLVLLAVQIDVSFEEKRLATIRDDLDYTHSSFFSPDGRRAAYVGRRGEDWFVVVNDKTGAEFKGTSTPTFSADGKSYAYAAFDGSKECVVWNEKRGAKYDGVGIPMMPPSMIDRQEPLYSDIMRTFQFFGAENLPVYVAAKGMEQVLVVGDKEGEAFDHVSIPEISPDGSTIAHAGRKGKKCYMVVGGKKSEAYDYIGLMDPPFYDPSLTDPFGDPSAQEMAMKMTFGWRAVVFSRDGKHTAFRACRGGTYLEGHYLGGDKSFMVIDGKKGGEFEEVGRPVFSPDGKSVAYWAIEAKKRTLVASEQPLTTFEMAPDTYWGESVPVWSPDGKTVAYSFQKAKEQLVVVADGKEGKPYRNVGGLTFAPDGKTLCYSASKDGKSYVIVMGDKEISTEKGSATGLTFSRDGKSYAYVSIAEDKSCAVVGGKQGKMYSGVGQLTLAPDGVAAAYVADEGENCRVVVGEKEYGPFDRVKRLTWSPDGKKLGFAAVKGNELWWKVVGVP